LLTLPELVATSTSLQGLKDARYWLKGYNPPLVVMLSKLVAELTYICPHIKDQCDARLAENMRAVGLRIIVWDIPPHLQSQAPEKRPCCRLNHGAIKHIQQILSKAQKGVEPDVTTVLKRARVSYDTYSMWNARNGTARI
jgi:hypothetical protein